MEDNKQYIEDKNTSLTIRTKESLKDAFKSINGNTDNDKLIKLLELYKKFETTQDKFNIDNNLDIIDKAMNTIKSQITAIVSATNQYERTLHQEYIVNVADEMKLLKDDIENEEILNAKILKLESEVERLNNDIESKHLQNESLNEELTNLKSENNRYIALNIELVNKENNYINQLREKDNVIDMKQAEIDEKLLHNMEDMDLLESKYKEDIEELKKVHAVTIGTIKKELIEADKEKAILENNINNLTDDNKQLKEDHRLEIDKLKAKIEELLKDNKTIALEKAKLEAKIELLESKPTKKTTKDK